MKPFVDLKAEDLRSTPIWKYESPEGDDVALVQAEQSTQVSEGDDSVYVVGTTFRLADGTVLPGVSSPQDPSGLDYLQPVLFYGDRHVRLWSGHSDHLVVDRVCDALHRELIAVFPIEFECNVPVDEKVVFGSITITTELPNKALHLAVRSKHHRALGRTKGRGETMEELLHDARMRVLHLCLIVLALIVGILSQISLPSPMPPSAILNLAVFAVGCILIGTLAGIWLRSRFRATHRLLALVQTGECRIRKTELTRLRLYWVPFGAEVDVHLASREHLAFGFWSEDSAERLLARLQPYFVAEDGPPPPRDRE